MELAMGAMGPLFPKLLQLLEDEYVLQRGLKGKVESLSREIAMVHATLVDVSRVPPERLKEQDKLWARCIRELSYDMEDAIDAFMVRVARREAVPADASIFKKVARKFTKPIKKMKERHHISEKIQDIKNLSKELSELRARYAFNGEVPPVNTGIDPRVINLYKNEGELVGIEKARDQLIRMLTQPEDHKSLKIISIVGCGGLGKTTLAKLVHDKLKAQSFQCCAIVSVGRNPNITNTFRELYEKLAGNNCSSKVNWTAERFCEELHELLKDKRYNILVDDVWEKKTWDSISCALPDSKCGSKVIVTTRNSEVGTKASDVYKLKPLPLEKSKELFYKRTTGSNNGDDKLVEKIVDKCDGVPLAIIAIASLLANRPLEDWQMVYSSLIFGREDERTREILLYSYYDLPSYLRPCLLYMSMYPEDSFIEKSSLIWRWIAEGFVQSEKEGGSLSAVGERYFNELVNRSMIEPANDEGYMLEGCRVHDIVLDLICDLSTEENFVTVLSEKKFATSEKDTSRKEDLKVRRLSIQWSKGVELDIFKDTIGMPKVVRSIHTIDCSVDGIMLSSFQACRVLAVEGIINYNEHIRNLEHLGKLLNLRYLEINTFQELPSEIGDLKCLQTLITSAKVLPSSVCELTQLMCLQAVNAVSFPDDRIGNLVRLEELVLQVTTQDAADVFVIKLGKLIRLRVLSIDFDLDDDSSMNETFYMALIPSLNNLQECGSLRLMKHGILHHERRTAVVSAWKSWEPPRQLWHLYTDMVSLQLIDLSRCRCLRYLDLIEMNIVDIGILALLPELVYVQLHDLRSYLFTDVCIIVGAEGFKNLRVWKVPRKFKFLPGAMPRLESLSFMVGPVEGDLDFGLGNLVSLKELEFDIVCYSFEFEETRAVLKGAVKGHPNRPTLTTRLSQQLKPDKALSYTIRARDQHVIDKIDEFQSQYPCLEEINIEINCEGSKLSEVEQLEAGVRLLAACHPSRPKLVMKRQVKATSVTRIHNYRRYSSEELTSNGRGQSPNTPSLSED